jgi:hypothetical protein
MVTDTAFDLGTETECLSWSDNALVQLEATADFLDQCLAKDFKDLERQQHSLNNCRNQIVELKKS